VFAAREFVAEAGHRLSRPDNNGNKLKVNSKPYVRINDEWK